MSTLLVTGGAGFIGTNFVYFWHRRHPGDRIVIIDALTYAGNRANLAALDGDPAVHFVHGDICDERLLAELFVTHGIDRVVHLAAESHVDRSIAAPDAFIRTNVQGTHALLKTALNTWKADFEGKRFHHVSTDEVYGSLAPDDPPFTETSRYDPKSPYAASKAASDFLVRSYANTYGLPVSISNSSNNYGPHQFPEKLIPLVILNALAGRTLPVYGDGLNVRDWLHVEDHCVALAMILEHGKIGETYNVGGGNEVPNIELVNMLCATIDRRLGGDMDLIRRYPNCPAARRSPSRELITYVTDRPGHDRRYAIDDTKMSREFGPIARRALFDGLAQTVDWYIDNEPWCRQIQSGEYRRWITSHYGSALDHPPAIADVAKK